MPFKPSQECLDFIREVLSSGEDFPKEALIAQAMFESGWFRYKIGRYNVLGIKYNPSRHKNYVLVNTVEHFTPEELDRWMNDKRFPARKVLSSHQSSGSPARKRYRVTDYFADYDSVEELIADYIRLMNTSRYKPHLDAWRKHRDWRRFLRDIAKIYATDPDYASNAIKVGEMALSAALSNNLLV